ncbi:serine palmitoyltransferase 1-like [Homarus americanus]|uniref:Serine palmitoyltransferase 1 n=1 Tax=Homarus americanus TaxID=6706 RepID=A0A8J5NBV3_HOMAM|nr:serine palmitoyltransferase 1-like [Homarus americanus]KAG7176559.1 Serine palmitoyltransferase 1-like [Homarus americanus]
MSSQWNVYESFQALLQAGPYHLALEGVLVMCIIWLFTAKKQPSKLIRLTKKEEEELIAEWMPEPLVPNPPKEDHPALHTRTIYGKPGRYLDLGTGEKLLNLGTHSYLNLGERPEVEEAALECLHKYGVGSCGPRGFYGTTEVHLKLEDRLAVFFNCEKAVLYSYGFSTSASAIPAYSKSGDVIYADEMVNFALQRGLQASRSRIVYFRHNDVEHLRELLEEQSRLDKKDPKKANATRKFMVVESIYINTGMMCPLPELVKLRQKYKLRLFIDESVTFGTLGPNCRGITDHYNIPMKEVDMIMANLESSAASSGGFCVGTEFVIEHQRLSGLGYCFSASLPPMLAAASIKVLDILESEGCELVVVLQDKCRQIQEVLSKLSSKLEVSGEDISPVKHLRLRESTGDREADENILRKIVEKAESHGLALTLASYLWEKEASPPLPSIRITVNKDLTTEEIQKVGEAIQKAVMEVME